MQRVKVFGMNFAHNNNKNSRDILYWGSDMLVAKPVAELSLSRKLRMQQLVMIEQIIESGSLMRAASILGMTQSALTKALHELEQYFDMSLFERTNRGVKPTEFGQLVSSRAKVLLSEMRILTDEVNTYRAGSAGHVTVGTLIAASVQLLPLTLLQLYKTQPNIRVTVRDVTAPQLYSVLMSGEVDVVVGRLPEPELSLSHPNELRHEALFNEKWCLVAGSLQLHDLPEVPNLAEMTDLLWILPLKDSPARMVIERMFRQAGLPLPVKHIESLSQLTNLGMMLAGPCVCMMPWSAAQPFIQAGLLRRLEVHALGPFGTIGYSVKACDSMSPASKKFIDCLKDVVMRHQSTS